MENYSERECFKMMARHSPDILCCVTFKRQCTYCSPSSLRVLGWEPEEMLLYFPNDLIHAGDASAARLAHERHLAGEEENDKPRTMRVRKKDGSYAWLEVNSSLMRHEGTNAPWKVLLNMRDVSQRRLFNQQLESMALTDPLTGLGNRRAFTWALEHEWARARRAKGEVSLLMVDVDHFKGVNDEYGHDVGDDCLRTIAAALASGGRRPGDLAVRYGGEEFALILPATDAEGAAEVAEHVRLAILALRLPNSTNLEHESVVTVSVGSATAVLDPVGGFAEPSSLLKAADTALYRAKQQGRNRVETAMIVSPPR